MPTTYRFKIVQAGRELEVEGDKGFVLQMVKRFGTAPPEPSPAAPDDRSAKTSSKPATIIARTGKSLSIREFIQQLDLKKHTDIVLAFGYYLEKHQGSSDFTPADINNCYYEAKLEPSNTSQMIILDIKRGVLMESQKNDGKGKKRYTVTSSGERFIEKIAQRTP